MDSPRRAVKQRDKYDLRQFSTDTIPVVEAAKIMRVSTGVVRRLLESGELHGGRFNKTWRVNRALLYQYIIDNRTNDKD